MCAKKKTISSFGLVLVFIGAVLTQNSCGGSIQGSSPEVGGGRVQIQIFWPSVPSSTSRYIPPYAQSLYFEMYRKNGVGERYRLFANRPSDRPTSQTVAFEDLIPAGAYIIACAARTERNGQGDTVAIGAAEVEVLSGQVFNVDITLESAIQTLKILPDPVKVSRGVQLQLSVQAIDKTGKILLLPNDALSWEIVSGQNYISLSSSGLLTGNSRGVARIRVSETGAGVSAEADVEVQEQTVPRFVWVCTSTRRLGYINLATGEFTQVSYTRTVLSDIAWMRNSNELYGVAGTRLYAIDPSSGFLSEVARLPRTVVGLAADDRYLYAAGGLSVYKVDPRTGNVIEELRFEGGTVAGDLDLDPSSGDFFITTYDRTLVRYNPRTRSSATVGSTHPHRFFGIAITPDGLFGCSTITNQLMLIDVTNGSVSAVHDLPNIGEVNGMSTK